MPDTTLVRCMRLFRQVYADTRGSAMSAAVVSVSRASSELSEKCCVLDKTDA